jgi:hypothetical protein
MGPLSHQSGYIGPLVVPVAALVRARIPGAKIVDRPSRHSYGRPTDTDLRDYERERRSGSVPACAAVKASGLLGARRRARAARMR